MTAREVMISPTWPEWEKLSFLLFCTFWIIVSIIFLYKLLYKSKFFLSLYYMCVNVTCDFTSEFQFVTPESRTWRNSSTLLNNNTLETKRKCWMWFRTGCKIISINLWVSYGFLEWLCCRQSGCLHRFCGQSCGRSITLTDTSCTNDFENRERR